MKEENYSYLGFGCFFFFIVILVIIGSVILYKNSNLSFNKINSSSFQTDINEKNKKDGEKDFVYYTLEEVVSTDLGLKYRKANVNIDSDDAVKVNEELDKLYDEVLLSIKKSNETDAICENGSDIYTAISIDYAVYTYNNYLTLLITENKYSCITDIFEPYSIKTYTFDIKTGKLITDEDLINGYGVTYTEILNKIEYQLKNQQTIINEVENIKVNETLNELKVNETYAIYISETKKLVVKYIVKTNSVDYNDIIELN